MPDVLWLYARGPNEETRRWPLAPGLWTVGRAPAQSDGQAPEPHSLQVPWDPTLSRRHFTLRCNQTDVEITRLESAANPIYYQGQARDHFSLPCGEHFVVGQTRFHTLLKPSEEIPTPAQEFTIAHGARRRLQEQKAAECLQVLTRLLPTLRQAATTAELWSAALSILESLLPAATRIVPLKVEPDGSFTVEPNGRATSLPYAPSRRLLQLAFASGQTAVHQWTPASEAEMTMVAGVQWALASPISISERERYALYAVGVDDPATGEQERALIDLVGESLGHFLSARRADRIRAQVGQFFSPTLRDRIDEHSLDDLLQPVRRLVSVMFFDLRGFSKATEKAEGDALAKVLEHHALLTEVMTLATGCVFAQEGIVLDFAGDAIMAGWGAPADQPDHCQRAVAAAIDIVTRIQAMTLPFEAPSGGLRCGIGLACGEVVAGQLGGREQIKYGWMGAVVNQAARLEGLTKYFGIPILLTGPLRAGLGQRSDLRRIGVARPAGMNEGVELYEVVLPRESGGSGLTPTEIADYETAQAAFAKGDMLETIKLLRQVPVEDPVSRFLARQAYRYEETGVPSPWPGWIEFHTK
jgi:adenylate cyclase